MSKAPYRHSDGSDCYTKNCSLGHYTNSDSAIAKGDINAFLDAKEQETKPARDIVLVGDQHYNVSVLVEKGYDAKRVANIFSRPIGDSNIPAAEEQKALRIQCMISEEKFDKKYEEITTKKFPPLTSKKNKQNYYENAMKELYAFEEEVSSLANDSLIAEQTQDFSYSRMNPMKNAYAYVQDGPIEMPHLPEQKNKVRIVHAFVNLHHKLRKEELVSPNVRFV